MEYNFFRACVNSFPEVGCRIASTRLLQCKTSNSASNLWANAKLHPVYSIQKQSNILCICFSVFNKVLPEFVCEIVFLC